jgi:hypothetical protein
VCGCGFAIDLYLEVIPSADNCQVKQIYVLFSLNIVFELCVCIEGAVVLSFVVIVWGGKLW